MKIIFAALYYNMAKITCTKCKLEKDDIEFHRSKTIKRGYTFRCKQCLSEDVKEKAFTPESAVQPINR